MAIGTLSPVAVQQFFDANGNPLAGGTLGFFLAGTDTPSPAYADPGVTVPLANPVVLDSAGRAPELFLDALSYKQVLKNALGTTIWTADHVQSGALVAQLSFQPVVTTITGTGIQHNVATGFGHNRILSVNNTAGDLIITGFAAGNDGDLLLVVATGTSNVHLMPDDTGSLLPNRLTNSARSGATSLVGGYGLATYEYLAVTQRWRLINHDQGHFITLPYAAGNFVAGGGSAPVWTVEAADVGELRYLLVGSTVHVNVALNSTYVGGTPTELQISGWPYLFMGPDGVAAQVTSWTFLENSAAYLPILAFTRGGYVNRTFYLQKASVGSTTIAAGQAWIWGQGRFEVQ